MIILFHCGLLLLSPICKFHYGHSEDSVCENISSYALSLKVFLFSKVVIVILWFLTVARNFVNVPLNCLPQT